MQNLEVDPSKVGHRVSVGTGTTSAQTRGSGSLPPYDGSPANQRCTCSHQSMETNDDGFGTTVVEPSPPLRTPSPRERNTGLRENESFHGFRSKCACNRVLASDMKSMVMRALASIVVVCEWIKRTKFRERRREITIAPSGRGSVFPVHPTPNVIASSRGSDLIKSRTATQEPNCQMGVTTRD
jgi:hypothetical protein